jgi:hypothetical protein
MIKSILFLAAMITIFGVLFLTYSRLGAFSFAGGSDSTLRVVRSPALIIVAVSMGLSLYLAFLIYYSKPGIVEHIVLVLLPMIWIISGRAVGIFPDGRIVTGWFFFPDGRIDFRTHNTDHELYIARTQILINLGWILEIINEEQSAKVFVGPLLQNPLLKLLEEIGFGLTNESETQ